MKSRPGRMNIPMRVERRTYTKGPGGDKIEQWGYFTTILADKQMLNAIQTSPNRQGQVRYMYEMRTQMIQGVTPNNMRMFDTVSGETFMIRAVNDLDNRGQILQMRCEVYE